MSYESVDQLQKVLAEEIFQGRESAKKAAGRALGTLVEIIAFYLLKTWGFETSLSIEKALAEHGNSEITHNVEYALHPILRRDTLALPTAKGSLTARRIFTELKKNAISCEGFQSTSNILRTQGGILRNACAIGRGKNSSLLALLIAPDISEAPQLVIVEQHNAPYAIVECKRVGIEEGQRRGPQTIEKAKQGAYVAKAVSSLHKLRAPDGKLHGIVFLPDGTLYSKPYDELIAEIVASESPQLLRHFVLTIGVVSNHGNWFTVEKHNKELKVLAQSYDWLLFLTDRGLSDFITELLRNPALEMEPVRTAFLASYATGSKANEFTKVQMRYEADKALTLYFNQNRERIEGWFNIITPKGVTGEELQRQLLLLSRKDWRTVHNK